MRQALLLGVNIDHIATLREVRKTQYPDPVLAAMEAEKAGADGITLHLREDLRHIQVRDVKLIKSVLQTPMNLEIAASEAMLDFAEEIRPEKICLVPERREELTTEGGLDLLHHASSIAMAVKRLNALGSEVSLFIDPDIRQIETALTLHAPAIEIHTGKYADAKTPMAQEEELGRIQEAANFALQNHLIVNAGHGLHYHNVKPIAKIEGLRELNIGHAIIARALFSGLHAAIKDMRQLMMEARHDDKQGCNCYSHSR